MPIDANWLKWRINNLNIMPLTSVHRLREQLELGRRYLAQMYFIHFYRAQSYDFCQFPANWQMVTSRMKLFSYAFFSSLGYFDPSIVWMKEIKYQLGAFRTKIQRRIQRRCPISKILKIEPSTSDFLGSIRAKSNFAQSAPIAVQKSIAKMLSGYFMTTPNRKLVCQYMSSSMRFSTAAP